MSSQRLLLLFTLVLALLLKIGVSNAQESHEHGHATLNVVADGDQFFIELESPAVNLVGFEHEPESDDQQAAIDKSTARLLDYRSLINLPEKAHCQIVDKSANWILDPEHDNHAEFHASYRFKCNLTNLDSIGLKLFDYFPGIEEIDAQILFPDIQLAVELDAQNKSIQLR